MRNQQQDMSWRAMIKLLCMSVSALNHFYLSISAVVTNNTSERILFSGQEMGHFHCCWNLVHLDEEWRRKCRECWESSINIVMKYLVQIILTTLWNSSSVLIHHKFYCNSQECIWVKKSVLIYSACNTKLRYLDPGTDSAYTGLWP